MSELLVCVANRGTSGRLEVDSHAPQIGDVVTILEDGEHWGRGPLGIPQDDDPNGNYPFFRILKLSNVSIDDAEFLLSAEKDIDPHHPSPYLQYRGFFIDHAKITDQALLAYLADDSRANRWIDLTYDTVWLDSVVSQRARILSP